MASVLNSITTTLSSIQVDMPDTVGVAFTVAAVAAGVVAPFAGRLVLRAKLKESNDFFDRRLREYCEFVRDHNRAPSMVGKPDSYERDLCAWMVYVKKQAADGQLDRDQVQRLADADVLSGNAKHKQMLVERAKPESSRVETYTLNVKWWMCVLCALVMGATVAMAGAVGASIASTVLLFMLMAVLVVCMVVDCKAYIIPYQLSYAAYPLAIAFAVSAMWPSFTGLIYGGLAAVICSMVFIVANKILGMRGNIMGVGGGDMRLLPAIALAGCGFGSFIGFVAMVLVMGVAGVFACIFGGKGLKSYLPMAPGLLTWLGVGCVVACGLGAVM